MSAWMVISATFFGVALAFIQIPEANRRLVEMFFDMYLLTGALSVLQHFVGRATIPDPKKMLFKEYSEKK